MGFAVHYKAGGARPLFTPGSVPLPFQDAQKLMRTGIAVTQVGVELRVATGERVNPHAVILSPSLYLRFQMPEK